MALVDGEPEGTGVNRDMADILADGEGRRERAWTVVVEEIQVGSRSGPRVGPDGGLELRDDMAHAVVAARPAVQYGKLRRHDRDHATDYLPTLRAWLEAQGDPTEAGNRLGVHENTVRYRLRKMAEITNLPLDDAKKRLAMMIELAATDTD